MNQEQPTNSVLNPFIGFFTDYGKLAAMTLGVGAIPTVLDLISAIGPPWPQRHAVAMFTSVMSWIVLPWGFTSWRTISATKLKTRLSLFAILTSLFLLIYILLKAVFVYNAPTEWNQEAAGFILQTKIQSLLDQVPEMSLLDAVRGAEFDPNEIWVPWTVAVVRGGLLVTWLLLFACLSLGSSAFLLFQEKGPSGAAKPWGASQNKKGRTKRSESKTKSRRGDKTGESTTTRDPDGEKGQP